MKKPQPINKETPFSFNELFFSTTDKKGVIKFGNEVFVRVSGYSKEILKGAPHSIIRHPDMPRSVFKLFWNTIGSGEPIAAYVKNLSADGSYYWVMAFVFPIEDGYLSVRVKPSSQLFEAAKNIYTATLTFEESQTLDESLSFLNEQILAAGFSSYRDFMIQAAFAEIMALDEKQTKKNKSTVNGALATIAEISDNTSEQLKGCFHTVQTFRKQNQTFVDTMKTLAEAFNNLKYIAMNMTISAAKFKEHGAAVGVVASEFSKLAQQIQVHLGGLSKFTELLSSSVQNSALKIVALDIQMKMVDFFICESAENINNSESSLENLLKNEGHFCSLFQNYTAGLQEDIGNLNTQLDGVTSQILEARKFATGLEVIRQMGAVETARENEMRQTFSYYLDEMQKFITLLQTSTHAVFKDLKQMKISSGEILEVLDQQAGRVGEIFALASKAANQQRQHENSPEQAQSA